MGKWALTWDSSAGWKRPERLFGASKPGKQASPFIPESLPQLLSLLAARDVVSLLPDEFLETDVSTALWTSLKTERHMALFLTPVGLTGEGLSLEV